MFLTILRVSVLPNDFIVLEWKIKVYLNYKWLEISPQQLKEKGKERLRCPQNGKETKLRNKGKFNKIPGDPEVPIPRLSLRLGVGASGTHGIIGYVSQFTNSQHVYFVLDITISIFVFPRNIRRIIVTGTLQRASWSFLFVSILKSLTSNAQL